MRARFSSSRPDTGRRIVVVGSSCAGKSTFSSALAQAMDSRHIELDELFWSPHWTPKPTHAFRALVDEAAQDASWVADGNYSLCRDILWPRAGVVMWLNYAYPRVLWQALKRTVSRALHGQVMWHGNRESVGRAFFSRDSILWWVITTYHRRNRKFQALRQSGQFPHLRWIEFNHPAQAAQWLEHIRATPDVPAIS